MDGFLEALSSPSKRRPGFSCGVARVLADMSEQHRAAVQQQIDELVAARRDGSTSRHSCESLARLLTDHGYRIRGPVMQSHVAGRCACGR